MTTCSRTRCSGRLTTGEWRRWGWLHTDHHLRQFGVSRVHAARRCRGLGRHRRGRTIRRGPAGHNVRHERRSVFANNSSAFSTGKKRTSASTRRSTDLPADKRGARAPGFEAQRVELLEHMRIAQEDILDFCVNPKYDPPAEVAG